jgi:signal transduction histidine kinase
VTSSGIDAQLLAAALGELPIGIVVVGPDGEVARASSQARDLLGNDLALLDASFATALQGTTTEASAEVAGRTVSFTARPLRDGEGAVVGAVAMVQDVSEQRRREQAERDFIANAAHELRTPLAAIASAVEVLEDGAKELKSERDLFLSHIAQQSDRLQRVISALLTIARFDARVERPKLEIVPVRRLLSTVARDLVPAPGVTVAVRCRPDIAVLAAPNLLEEALANIAANAIRYTERGSVLLSCRTHGRRAVIEIRDTGRGIPAAERELVFERFYRGGARDAQGFGLGLPIARRAVEAMGGEIALGGEEGKGTFVEIRLPIAHLVEGVS